MDDSTRQICVNCIYKHSCFRWSSQQLVNGRKFFIYWKEQTFQVSNGFPTFLMSFNSKDLINNFWLQHFCFLEATVQKVQATRRTQGKSKTYIINVKYQILFSVVSKVRRRKNTLKNTELHKWKKLLSKKGILTKLGIVNYWVSRFFFPMYIFIWKQLRSGALVKQCFILE